MKVVQINHFSYKAAGNIMMNLHHSMQDKGIESYVVWGRGRSANSDHEYYMNDSTGVKIHALATRLTDRTGFFSVSSTRKLLQWIDHIKPDIIHLHCIHGYYLNIKLLFNFLKEKKIKVIWTIHDCWPFTGHCAYFDMCRCDKWQCGCHDCQQLGTYPKSLVDHSEKNWIQKRKLFQNADIILVSPSNWLKETIEKSFLNSYKIEMIYNGVDLDKFKPVAVNESEFVLNKYNLDRRPIVLGVASEWSERKGLNDFIEMSRRLVQFQFIVVGLTAKQIRLMPDTIIGIERTENIDELISLYSISNLFFNPTYEEVFGMVNIEALACATPVLTYNSGGSPETIDYGKNNKIGAMIVKKNNNTVEFDEVESQIIKNIRLKNDVDSSITCLNWVKRFDVKNMIDQYLKLYEEVYLR